MRLIIAGKRDWHIGMTELQSLIRGAGWYVQDITEIVSGGATGIDSKGELLARITSTPIRLFPADWKKHGPAAGPIRNRQMAEYADALLLIWDGKSKGSASMLKEARKAGLKIVQVVMEEGGSR